jgi:hypothetical protein
MNGNACSSYFAKIKISDLSIDALNLSLNGVVRKIYLTGSTIYLAGDFTSILGSTRNRFAKVNMVDGSPVLDDLNVNVAGTSVYTFLINGTTLYLGGNFTSVSGTARLNFASYDLTNLQLNAWNPGTLNGYPNSIYIYGTQMIIGGSFNSMDIVSRAGMAAYNTATGVISS